MEKETEKVKNIIILVELFLKENILKEKSGTVKDLMEMEILYMN